MSNNVTRKGLAFGALVALTSTAIAGAPAMAAGEINLVPGAGTSFNTIAGEKFVLEASFAAGFAPADASQLKYKVTTDGSAINAAVLTTDRTASPIVPATYALAAAATTANLTLNSSNAGVLASGRTANTDRSFLILDMAAGSTESVKVEAFADANNNGALDSGEWSTEKTVGFKKLGDVAVTITPEAQIAGTGSLVANLNFGDLNTAQIADNSFRTFAKIGAGSYSSAANNTVIKTDGTYTATVTLTGNTAAGDLITILASYKKGGAATSTDTPVGSTATTSAVTVGWASVKSIKGSAASGQLETVTSGTSSTVGAINVKKNDTFAVTAVVQDAASTPAVVAGATVEAAVTLTGNTLNTATDTTAKNITVNGVKFTDAAKLPGQSGVAKLVLTSNAKGEVVVNISSTGLVDGNTITVAFSRGSVSGSTVVTQKDLAYTIADTNASRTYSAAPGSTTAVALTVEDQFGVAIDGTHRVKAVVTQNSVTRDYYADVVKGAATVSVIDGQTTTTNASTIAFSLEKQGTTGGWSSATATSATTTINYTTAADTFLVSPSVTHIGGAVATSTAKQTVAADALADVADPTSSTLGDTTWARIAFTGNNSGQKVTVSAPGAMIFANGKATAESAVTYGSVVFVASNTAGKKTVSLTTGSTTKTVDVTFAAGGTSTAAKLALNVPAAVQAGRAIDGTVTVTDAYGNAISGFTAVVTVSGVAVVNGGYTAEVVTNASGVATFKISANLNDLGDATVTVADKLNASGVSATNNVPATAPITAVAKTVVFGQTDGYIDILNGKRASVTWSMAKGKRVAFLLNGVRKYNFVQTGDAELNLQFNLKKGTNNIKLLIGGVIVDDLTVNITK